MNTSDDEFLERLVCGDLDETDPAVARRLAANPALARRRADLVALRARLDAEAREERLVSAEARALGKPGDATFVREHLERAAGSAVGATAREHTRQVPSRDRAPRQRLAVRLLAAAAVLVALAALARTLLQRPDPARGPVMLGGAAIELEAPQDGAVYDADQGFRWRYTPAPGSRVVLVLTGRGADGRPVTRRFPAPVSPWKPTPEDLAGLPAECTWLVLVAGTDGGPGESSESRRVSFSRPPPR